MSGIKAMAFSGHRPQSFPFSLERMSHGCALLETRITDEVHRRAREGCETFYCGCAHGCDIVFGEIIVAAKERFPDIRLVGAIPFPGQERGWSQHWRDRYERLLALCDEKVVICESYHGGCYYERNRYMVDNSQMLLAVWNGSKGGTSYTVDYARSLGRQVVIIPQEG